MDKIIKEQLNKCKVANIPFFDDSTTEILIQKGGKAIIKDDLVLNHYYKIEVEDYIVKPYDGFNLASNWNRGIIPQSKILGVKLIQKLGKMCLFDAYGIDDNLNQIENQHYPNLWLPRKSFHIIEEIS